MIYLIILTINETFINFRKQESKEFEGELVKEFEGEFNCLEEGSKKFSSKTKRS